ncbi:MAG: hypothetical protein KY453_04995 [Gemmatimonadetes bacterium]|nr:hypothetical protein [Gemmatimonadota bacterium]
MFEDLRDAFREAVDNFKRELNRDQVPEAVDRLLAGMRDEAADARARVKRLEDDLAETRSRAGREKEEESTCRRREALAKRIGDEDTARLAGEYAAKHGRRREVLEGKVEALERELELGRAEFDEMLARLKEARERRASLSASAGRTGAREALGGADDLFSELDRMAERIADEDRRQEAAGSLDLDGAEGSSDGEDLRVRRDESPRPPLDVDARLEELKRRMGRD